MNPKYHPGIFCCVAVAALFSTTAFAKPRPPSPPWPEVGMLCYESFDQPLKFAAGQAVDTSIWAESWTGYALNRLGPVVQPYAIPMVNEGTNRTLNVDPECGAVRFWYRPAWSGGWTGQGSGPGEAARIVTLASINESSAVDWWSLEITENGNELQLVCGSSVRLSVMIDWEAGSWHMLAVGYTPTNSALIVDGQVVAVGSGLPSLPVEAASSTYLVVGSDALGNNTAQGQFEQLAVFTGRNRFRSMTGHPFGMGNVEYYYTAFSGDAARGPITAEDEQARQLLAEANRASALTARAALQEAAALERQTLLELDYDPEQPFRLLTPEVVNGTNLLLSIANADPELSYDILHTPGLEIPNWNIISTGAVGQILFTVPMTGMHGFFRGVQGGDWDGDGIPNWMDASPFDSGVGALAITIEAPVHGSTIY